MIKALLFDLDGTLFDSSAANVAAYGQAFQEAGLVFDEAAYIRLFGLRFSEMIEILAPDASEVTRQRVKDLKTVYYAENMNLTVPNTGLLALLKSSRGTFKTALVTTARLENVTSVLTHFSIEEDMFDCIITAENVNKGKPDPECYLLAMQQLRVEPTECCIFEDSEVGIAAAQAAGAEYVRVRI